MSKRRVLLATPVRYGLTARYMEGFTPSIRVDRPFLSIEPLIVSQTLPNVARNDIAHYAVQMGYDDVIMVDDDIGYTVDDLFRLLGHDAPIVGALYCKRQPGMPEWLVNLKAGCEIGGDGLCEVLSVGAGLLRIQTSVFATMKAKTPERTYVDHGVRKHEFFPVGIINEQLTGEDNYFCHLARQCGFRIMADFGLVVPHWGPEPHPITPDMVGMDPKALLEEKPNENRQRTTW